MALVGTVLVAGLTTVSLQAFTRIDREDEQVARFERAAHLVSQIEQQNIELDAYVSAAMFASQGIGDVDQVRAEASITGYALAQDTNFDQLRAIELDIDVEQSLADIASLMQDHSHEARDIVMESFADPRAAASRIPDLQASSETFALRLDSLHARIDETANAARAAANDTRDDASTRLLLLGGLATLALLAMSYFIGRSVIRSLRRLGSAAHAIADGNLAARTDQTGSDEIGELGQAFNNMADELQTLMAQLSADAERDGFASQLTEAFEMADTESEAHRVVERAMTEVAPDRPMELLLADSSKAHLERCAVHPATGAPGCSVESPFACVAVRRGNPAVFESSEALSACPKLRGRASGACSAVCVPVTFMGRALGVLHTSGPENQPATADQVTQLTTLATQAGGRIGTVRSFERSRRQASNDGLTGLLNRRTFEGEARALLRDDVPFALAIADLDHFKLLNDTYGHEAGDRALRRFAETVRSFVRTDDLICRYGGEEFVIAFPQMSVAACVDVVDRLRLALAEADSSVAPSCTASFGVTDSSVGASLDEIIRVADAALYRAKQDGRNQVTIGDPSDAGGSRRSALDDGEPSKTRSRRPASAFEAAAYDDDPMPELPVA